MNLRPRLLLLLSLLFSVPCLLTAAEEAGMKECAQWLKTFVPEVPIHFISTPEPFWSPEAK